MSPEDWERANEVVKDLLALKKKKGRLSHADLATAAVKVGRSQETVYRWLRAGAPPSPVRKRFELTRNHQIELMASGGHRRRAFDRLTEAGEIECSLRTFEKAYERDMSARLKAFATHGPRKGRFVGLRQVRQEPGRGLCFEGDHKQAEVWIKAPDKESLVRPWVTVFIDTWSRAIAGVAVSVRPNQSTILKSMKASFGEQPQYPRQKGGEDAQEEDPPNENVIGALGSAFDYWPNISPINHVPEELRLDRGLDFMADSIAEACTHLDIDIDVTDAYTPNQKGKIERVFLSMQTMLFATMPYFTLGPERKDGSLDVPKRVEPISYVVFVQKVLDWVRKYNFELIHSEIGMTPTAKWNSGTTPIRVPNQDDLNRFLLKKIAVRKVEARGIMMHRRWYLCAEADHELQRDVEVRGLPHDERRYELYSLRTGKWIGTAWDQSQLPKEVRKNVKTAEKEARREAQAIYQAGRRREETRWEASVAAEDPEQTNLIPEQEKERLLREHESPYLELLGNAEQRDQKWEG